MINEKKLDNLAEEQSRTVFSPCIRSMVSRNAALINGKELYLAGYRAAEKEAEELVRALEDCVHSLENCDEQNWVKGSIKLGKQALSKWRERGSC